MQLESTKNSALNNNKPKSFLNSKTIWGAVLTAAVAIVPIVVSMLQVPPYCEDQKGQLACEELRKNQRIADIGQIVLIVLGTTLTVIGRVRATQPIDR